MSWMINGWTTLSTKAKKKQQQQQGNSVVDLGKGPKDLPELRLAGSSPSYLSATSLLQGLDPPVIHAICEKC